MSARVTCSCGWTKTYPSAAKAEFNARRHVCTAGQKPKARRADRSYRCARCGFEATYLQVTAAAGRHFFGRHSCRRQEDRMVRAAQAEVREALIDRTPKPCTHKIADHQCGTRAKYVLDKCRCTPCSKANSKAEIWRERQKAYGRYHRYVPAEFVREHLRELMAYGIGLKQVTRLTGINGGTMNKIMYGSASRLDKGPSVRVTRETAERIYAVEPIPTNLAAGAGDRHRTPNARRHLQALVALGWSMSELGRRLGTEWGGNACATITGDRTLSRGTVDKAEALYAELSMTLPPETNQRERIAASRSRKYAKAHGWLPPLALEDIDDAELVDGPDIDDVAIQRRMDGDKTVHLSKEEKAELRRRWVKAGRSLNELERITGVNSHRAYTQAAS